MGGDTCEAPQVWPAPIVPRRTHAGSAEREGLESAAMVRKPRIQPRPPSDWDAEVLDARDDAPGRLRGGGEQPGRGASGRQCACGPYALPGPGQGFPDVQPASVVQLVSVRPDTRVANPADRLVAP